MTVLAISQVQLAAHIERLIAHFQLKVKDCNRFDDKASHRAKTIHLSRVKSVVSYFLGLRAIAHVVCPKATTGTRIEKEYYAWQWVLRMSLVSQITPQIARIIHDRLNTYVQVAKERKANKKRAKLPGDDHPLWRFLTTLEKVFVSK